MLKIRLQRTGRINQPSYRIIVTEHARAAKTGSIVEQLGTYNPATKARTLKIERVKYWLSVGAQASGTMHNMLVSLGIISGKKINVLPKKSPPKKEEVAVEAPAPEVKEEAKEVQEAQAVEEKPVEVQA
ncbi:30S ribosomal protein S16 [Candidatus Kaiserbacteria bacterium]|nr:30S ribosomal protein S16 [Candidatus Kaiserbacteria bacterium]